MKLLIEGKYIQIDDFVELVSESPLINNFDYQLATYSNSFEVKYSGGIADLIDISKLRTTASPYLMIDGFLIDGVIFIPVAILINSFDPNKNTVKMNVSERASSIGGINIRSTKLTALRHYVNGSTDQTDEILLANGQLDCPIEDDSVLADVQPYPPYASNTCPVVSIDKLITFLNVRYGLLVEGAPTGKNFFANRQMPFFGDIVRSSIEVDTGYSGPSSLVFSPYGLIDFPAGVLSNGFLESSLGSKTVTYKNKQGDADGYLVSCRITADEGYNPGNYAVYFKDVEVPYIGSDLNTMLFAITDKDATITGLVKGSGGDIDKILAFRVVCYEDTHYDFEAYCRFNIDIPQNTVQATSVNSRQVFQNMPDVTIIDFFKTIAKASAKYLELTATGFKFVNIASILDGKAILDASPYLIEVKGISYSLYDSPALEYWYKDAATATLIVPITDTRVKGAAKKIEINMLRTDDANVSLFEADGIKPLVGIATYPFLDITNQAGALVTFYEAIQNPFVVTATFKNFGLNFSNSVLIRQLNGLFVPKKIIKTNRDIIELELLKIEIPDFGTDIIISENNTFVLICEDGVHYVAQEGE